MLGALEPVVPIHDGNTRTSYGKRRADILC
jgi:hypothetical protein